MKFPPTFDGRVILYPSFDNLKDYFSWRQVDCHINNLYNTTFWALVLIGKLSKDEAHNKLKGTFSKDKNEILFREYNLNYNFIEDIYKRGTLIFRYKAELKTKKEKKEDNLISLHELSLENEQIDLISLTDKLLRADEAYIKLLEAYYGNNIFLTHDDVIQDSFWKKFNLTV